VQEQEYIRLPERTLEPGMLIKSGSTQMIKLPVLITYDNLFNSLDGIRDLSSLSCYIMGEMTFSRSRRRRGGLPFAFSGDFPLFREPSAALSAIRTKSLTIGGADLDVEITIVNPNGFSLKVDELEYDLKFGGHPIKQGRIRSGGSVGAASHSVLLIPLLFNFFEVGKDVHGLLEQDTATCQITGKLHIQTDWGRLSLPYEINQQVPVLR
jgi:LEA14-like dessication related protein